MSDDAQAKDRAARRKAARIDALQRELRGCRDKDVDAILAALEAEGVKAQPSAVKPAETRTAKSTKAARAEKR